MTRDRDEFEDPPRKRPETLTDVYEFLSADAGVLMDEGEEGTKIVVLSFVEDVYSEDRFEAAVSLEDAVRMIRQLTSALEMHDSLDLLDNDEPLPG